MAASTLTDGLQQLPAGDRRLLLACFAAALVALLAGVLAGAGTALARAGFLGTDPVSGYRMMTAHGVNVFFYWLYFVQAGLLLAFAAVYTESAARVAWRGLGWAGLALMIAGFLFNGYAVASGLPLLYDAPPQLAGAPSAPVAAFYLGYLLLAAGLACMAVTGIATTVMPRMQGRIGEWSAVAFASAAWAGLLLVTGIASVNAFLPAARWALGMGPLPADYSVSWHVLFHNMHYLPLMATVLTWYVLVEAVTGVKSVFGARFSKIVFAAYLILVPPTSLYHMFLEPGLAPAVRVAGSLLSLFISVPTVLVFLVIVSSLEVHARAQGATGLFGWLRLLPWRHPAMAAMGAGVVNLALGGAFSFVLIQEKLAPLLSDTFFVPGYFHFLTVGTVTLTFLAALACIVPALLGRPLWRPRALAALPWMVTAGLLVFGAAGIAAGYLGVPRRMLDVSFAGDAPAVWSMLMAAMGIGGAVMAAGLLVYIYLIARTPLPGAEPAPPALPTVDWQGSAASTARAWTGPLSILVLVACMALFTSLAFELLQSLPIAATGGHGGH